MPYTVSHSVEVDQEKLLVDVRLGGLLSTEDAMWIGEEVRAAIRELGDKVGQHVTLYDVSGVPVVAPATIDMLRTMWNTPQVKALWARKVAYVVSTALGRMQAQRLREARADIEVFDTREEALAWLLAD